MSTRHSFLSTTGLIRPHSPGADSIAPSTYAPSTHSAHADAGSGTRPGILKNKPRGRFSRHRPAHGPSTTETGAAPRLKTRAGIVPLGPRFVVGLALALSLLFVGALLFAFVADEQDAPPFARALDAVAANSPGIVLVGDSVDVDVDEPALTIRWSIIGCGAEYVLAGSQGSHGSTECGLPAMALSVFVDGADDATVKYDPTDFPFSSSTGKRNSIQNMFQFDSDHVLDVHEARLYPFDTYRLTSTVRIEQKDNGDHPIPLQRLLAVPQMSSFVIRAADGASFVQPKEGTQLPARDLELHVSRPGEARAYALLLYGLNWMLAHATVGMVALVWNRGGREIRGITQCLIATCAILLIVPQMRNAMPDAPGFDGVLLDTIGFFPQMIMCGVSAVFLLCIRVRRELDDSAPDPRESDEPKKEAPGSLAAGLMRMRRGSAAVDISHLRGFSRSLSMNAGRSTPTAY